MTLTRITLGVALCCTSIVARAAGQTNDVPATETGRTIQITLPPGADFTLPASRTTEPVRYAPYSADVIRERQQVLADGNQIVQRTRSRTYRDSAGRIRTEQLDENGTVRVITISDPVAGVFWTVNPGTKTAMSMPMAIRKRSASITTPDDGSQHILEQRNKSENGAAFSMRRVIPSKDGTMQSVPEKTTLRIVPNGNLAGQDQGSAPAMNPSLANAFADIKWSQQAQKRDLGVSELGGVKSTGQVRSYDIPAGEVGNRNPIVVSDTTWYAPDLHITVSSKHSDPRTGDTGFHVENIKREEPPAALFTPPAEYAVKDIKPRVLPARQLQ